MCCFHKQQGCQFLYSRVFFLRKLAWKKPIETFLQSSRRILLCHDDERTWPFIFMKQLQNCFKSNGHNYKHSQTYREAEVARVDYFSFLEITITENLIITHIHPDKERTSEGKEGSIPTLSSCDLPQRSNRKHPDWKHQKIGMVGPRLCSG